MAVLAEIFILKEKLNSTLTSAKQPFSGPNLQQRFRFPLECHHSMKFSYSSRLMKYGNIFWLTIVSYNYSNPSLCARAVDKNQNTQLIASAALIIFRITFPYLLQHSYDGTLHR